MLPKSLSFAQAWQARLRLGADMTRLVGGWRLSAWGSAFGKFTGPMLACSSQRLH